MIGVILTRIGPIDFVIGAGSLQDSPNIFQISFYQYLLEGHMIQGLIRKLIRNFFFTSSEGCCEGSCSKTT